MSCVMSLLQTSQSVFTSIYYQICTRLDVTQRAVVSGQPIDGIFMGHEVQEE